MACPILIFQYQEREKGYYDYYVRNTRNCLWIFEMTLSLYEDEETTVDVQYNMESKRKGRK